MEESSSEGEYLDDEEVSVTAVAVDAFNAGTETTGAPRAEVPPLLPGQKYPSMWGILKTPPPTHPPQPQHPLLISILSTDIICHQASP